MSVITWAFPRRTDTCMADDCDCPDDNAPHGENTDEEMDVDDDSDAP